MTMTRPCLTAWIAAPLTINLTIAGPRVAYASPPDAAAAHAEGLYAGRRFLEAARAFEALAKQHVKYFYYAGLAYEAVGHDGLAISHWRVVAEAAEVEPALRERARARAERAETRTTRLLISVTPATAALGSTVELSYQGGGGRRKRVLKLAKLVDGVHLESGTWKVEVRSPGQKYSPGAEEVTLGVHDAEKTVEVELVPMVETVLLTITPPEAVASLPRVTLRDDAGVEATLSFEVNESTSRLRLPRGLWRYRIEAPGFAPADGELHVRGGGNAEFAVALARSQARARPLVIGTSVSGVIFAIGGAVGLGLSERRLASLRTSGEFGAQYDTAAARVALDGIQFSSIAAGASVGFFVTAATAAAKQDRHRRRAWAAELTLGSLLSTGGAVWAGFALKNWTTPHLNASDPGEPQKTLTSGELDTYRANYYPAMLLIGTGAALVVGSVAGLALERRHARKRGGHAKARLRLLFPLTLDF